MSVDVHQQNGVATITINRPERKNALDQDHYKALAEAFAAAAADETVRVALLTGNGDVFCAGQDLGEMAKLAAGEPIPGHDVADGFVRMMQQLENFPKPLIGAVNGAGTGAGMTMLLHCDLVLMADSARLRTPFAELGVPPEAGSSALLADRVGWQHAAEMLFTARWIDARECVQIGVALRCVPAADLPGEAARLAETVAAMSPFATRTAKELMLAARGDRATVARERENARFAELFTRR